jgi:hypothetical protein
MVFGVGGWVRVKMTDSSLITTLTLTLTHPPTPSQLNKTFQKFNRCRAATVEKNNLPLPRRHRRSGSDNAAMDISGL